jgi:hypothetical protein
MSRSISIFYCSFSNSDLFTISFYYYNFIIVEVDTLFEVPPPPPPIFEKDENSLWKPPILLNDPIFPNPGIYPNPRIYPNPPPKKSSSSSMNILECPPKPLK